MQGVSEYAYNCADFIKTIVHVTFFLNKLKT